jgi:hypothetical protein
MNKLKILLSIVLLSSYGNAFAMQDAASSSIINPKAESRCNDVSLSELEESFKTIEDVKLLRSMISKALEIKKQELEMQLFNNTKPTMTEREIDAIYRIRDKEAYKSLHPLVSDILELLIQWRDSSLELEELFETAKDDTEFALASLTALTNKTQKLKEQHVDKTKGETLSITLKATESMLVIYAKYGKYMQSEDHQLYREVDKSASDLLEFLLSKKELLSTEVDACLREYVLDYDNT